jgi:putative transposase
MHELGGGASVCQPDYPGRFNDVLHARRWCEGYFGWYNFEHHHSDLAGFNPEQVFTGCYHEVARQKQRAPDYRYERHPERFVRGQPAVAMSPETVAINPVIESGEDSMIDARVYFPTLTVAGYVK